MDHQKEGPQIRIPLPWTVVCNFWSYYFLKHGLIKKAVLDFKSSPDTLRLEFDRESLHSQWDHIKHLMRSIIAFEFEYHADKNEMVVHSSGKKRRGLCDFRSVASWRYAMDNHMTLEACAQDGLFLTTVCGGAYKFYVRKGNPADLFTVRLVCEENEYGFLYPFLSGKVVVDVGANIGDTAVLFAKKGALSVDAYEIHPLLCDLARKNVALNGLENRVRLFDQGVGIADGQMIMCDDSALGPQAGFGSQQARFGRDVDVKIIAMSNVIRRMGKIDVLKMDCEGAEFDIFKSLSREELRKIDVIGLEYHREPQPLIDKFRSCGFEVKMVSNGGPTLGLMLAVKSL